MKKILLTATLLITNSLLFSQTKFGVKAGLNLATMKTDDINSEYQISPSTLTSFNFGGFAELKLSPTIYFQPALLVSGKGFKVDYSAQAGEYSVAIKSKINPILIEAPLNFIAKFKSGSGNFLLGAGPYIGYGIAGKTKGNFKIDGPGTAEDISMPTDGDIEYGDEEGEMKPFDYGLSLITGYELNKGLLFNIGYGLGLSDLSYGNEKAKNRVLSLSIGYKFK